MAYKVTTVYHRPDLSIPWHTEHLVGKSADGFLDTQVTYVMNARRNLRGIDTLTLTVENTWDNLEQFEKYNKEPAVIAQLQLLTSYNNAVGITVEPRLFEEI